MKTLILSLIFISSMIAQVDSIWLTAVYKADTTYYPVDTVYITYIQKSEQAYDLSPLGLDHEHHGLLMWHDGYAIISAAINDIVIRDRRIEYFSHTGFRLTENDFIFFINKKTWAVNSLYGY